MNDTKNCEFALNISIPDKSDNGLTGTGFCICFPIINPHAARICM